MKRLFIVITILYATSINAQSIDTKQLKSATWSATDVEYINVNGGFLHTTYTDSLCITDISLYEGSDTVHVESYYYLSDSKPKTFDATMVGKQTHGKYIIINERRRTLADPTWFDKLLIREVLEASSTHFVVKWDEKTICTFTKMPLIVKKPIRPITNGNLELRKDESISFSDMK